MQVSEKKSAMSFKLLLTELKFLVYAQLKGRSSPIKYPIAAALPVGVITANSVAAMPIATKIMAAVYLIDLRTCS